MQILKKIVVSEVNAHQCALNEQINIKYNNS